VGRRARRIDARASDRGGFAPHVPLAVLSGLGFAETAYLTVSKLLDVSVFCPATGTCETVLTSEYAELFGQPLSLYGMGAYGAVLALSLARAQASRNPEPGPGRLLDQGLVAGVAALATTSAYLMWVLFTEFQGDLCTWCLLSAGLSAGMLVAAAPVAAKEGDALRSGGSAAAGMAVTIGALLLGGPSDAAVTEVPYQEPLVATSSPPGALDLARDLNASGARMYGAFWCPHCLEQKEAFGAEAMGAFPYVECFPDGWKKGMEQAPACKEAGIRGYPTWVINGKKIEGGRDLPRLRDILEGKDVAGDEAYDDQL